RMPYYSINEANKALWDVPTNQLIENLKKQFPGISLRWVGTMVVDVHRTLLYGGLFTYPKDRKNSRGKLRLVYECNPMSFIVENSGGEATCDGLHHILDLCPHELHQKVPIFLGNKGLFQLNSSL